MAKLSLILLVGVCVLAIVKARPSGGYGEGFIGSKNGNGNGILNSASPAKSGDSCKGADGKCTGAGTNCCQSSCSCGDGSGGIGNYNGNSNGILNSGPPKGGSCDKCGCAPTGGPGIGNKNGNYNGVANSRK